MSSKRGYRSAEPDGLPRETSRLLGTVIRAMRSGGVAVPDIARQLTIKEPDLTEMILVSPPSLSPPQGSEPSLLPRPSSRAISGGR